MRFKSLIFAASLFIALLLLYPLSSSAEPLRIWVMHNEPVEAHGPITAERVQHGIERWRAQGIIIENSVQNLMVPAETKNPLAAYIVGRNGFLEELARFHRNEATNEPIAIEFIRWDDAYSRISSALKSGDTHTAPDVVQAGHSWILEMANDDRVADLSGHIGLNGFSPSSLADNRASLHGDLYAIPWFREMRLLYYNKMMVKSPSDLATWEGFLDASRSFNDEGGKRFLAFPITVTWNLLHNLAPWLWASGGDIVRAGKLGPFEIYRVAIDSPESARALLYLKELADSGSVDFPAVSQEVVDREFRDGKYAAIISGPWITKLLGDGWASRFGVAPIPAGPKGSFPFVGGSHLMVSEASRARGNFERAAAIVRHLTSEDAQLRFAAATGLYPVNRAALDKVLGSTGDGLFRNAVETGLKYPAMPDWGKIVENEFIRNHVWQIWRELAQGASGDTLVQTVAHAAGDLRKQIVISFAARYAPAMGLALGSIAFLGASFILVLRRRYRFTRWQCEEKERELKMTLAERTILESRAIVLERRYDDDSLELAGLRGELGSIQDKVAQLTSELAKAAAKHRSWDRNRIGEFSVRSDGTLIMGAEEVKFEHSRQARRLIDHLARQACSGSAEVHCLWGYPLFGWEAGKIQTEPRRLFETVAAKINGRLKVMGKPPLVERAGKRSSSWKLFWDKDSFVERSDVRRSQLEYENARDRFSNKEIKGACAHAIASLDLDPKNLDAVALLVQLRGLGDAAVELHKPRIESRLKIAEAFISQEIVSLKAGITSVKALITTGKIPRSIDAETAQSQLMAMEYHEGFLEKRFEGVFRRSAAHSRPMLIDEIACSMQAVQNEISGIKAKGASEEIVWASVVDSGCFTRLISIPHIRSLIHNLYNRDIQACEDPRLVQLALVSLLSSPNEIRAASEAKDERDLLTRIDRGLRRQLIALEQQLGSMAVM